MTGFVKHRCLLPWLLVLLLSVSSLKPGFSSSIVASEEINQDEASEDRRLQGASAEPTGSPQPTASFQPTTTYFPTATVFPTSSDTFRKRLAYDAFDEFYDIIERLDNVEALNEEIPFAKVSINEWIGGPGKTIVDVLDMTTFIRRRPLVTDTTEFAQDLEDFLAEDGFVEPSDKAATNCGGQAVLVEKPTLPLREIKITFCTKIFRNRTTELDPRFLFDTVPREYYRAEMPSPTVDGVASLVFDATLGIDLAGLRARPNVTIDPLIVELQIRDTVDTTFWLGLLETSAPNTAVSIDAFFELEYCDPDDPECTVDDPDANLFDQVSADANYTMSGVLEEGVPMQGLDFPVGATITVVESDLYDPLPEITVSNELEAQDFVFYGPNKAVTTLRQIESAFIRTQENEAFLQTNVYQTNVSYAETLFTGGMFTQNTMRLFLKVQDFDDRTSHSVTMLNTRVHDFSEEVNDTTTRNFEFLYLEDEFTSNLDDLDDTSGIRAEVEANGVVCAFSWSGTDFDVTDSDAFATRLRAKLNSCGLTAGCTGGFPCTCSYDADSTTFFGCNRNLVVDVDDDMNVFIATVGFTDDARTVGQDVHLIALTELRTLEVDEDVDFFGLPLNQPFTPALVTRYRNFEELVSQMDTSVSELFDDVAVEYEYIADDGGRYELSVSYAKAGSVETTLDGSAGIGDLEDIVLATSSLNVETSATYGTGFAIVLEPSQDGQIALVGSACNGTGVYECEIGTFDMQLTYTQAGVEDIPLTLSFTGGVGSTTDALAGQLGEIAEVREQGSSLLFIVFSSDISFISLEVPKDCIRTIDEETTETIPNQISCEKGQKSVFLNNAFGLIDEEILQPQFQTTVLYSTISATYNLTGVSDAAANVGGVIETSVESLETTLDTTLDIFIGNCSSNCSEPEVVPFTDWVLFVTAMLDFTSEDRQEGFVNASATVDGIYAATVTALEPVETVPELFTGGFNFPHVIDFSDPASTSAQASINFTIDLVGIGDVRKIPVSRVVDVLEQSMLFLVGEDELDVVSSCSGGWLAAELANLNVFTYTLPIIGVSPCRAVRFLQVVVDMVDTLVAQRDTPSNSTLTFATLGSQMETLIIDGDAEAATVNITTRTDAIRSELLFDIQFSWSFFDAEELVLDLPKVFQNFNLSDDDPILGFLYPIIPASGEGQFTLNKTLSFRLAFGLEYITDSDDEINSYLLGETAIDVGFFGDDFFEFEAFVGPVDGYMEIDLFVGDSLADPLSLRAGLTPGEGYYIGNETVGTGRFDYLNGTSQLVNELSTDYSGFLRADFKQYITLLDAFADYKVDIEDMNTFIEATPNSTEGRRLQGADASVNYTFGLGQFNVETLSPYPSLAPSLAPSSSPSIYCRFPRIRFLCRRERHNRTGIIGRIVTSVREIVRRRVEKVFSFGLFDLLKTQTKNIIESVQQIFEDANEAALGRDGILSQFDVPYLRNRVANALGAGSERSIILDAGRKVRDRLQEGLSLFGGIDVTVDDNYQKSASPSLSPSNVIHPTFSPSEETPERTLAAIIARVIQRPLERFGLLQDGRDVEHQCFRYNETSQAREEHQCGLFRGGTSTMWTIPLGGGVNFSETLDFDVGETDWPLEIGIDQDEDLTQLSISWSLTLAFGFDRSTGFFLYTFPDGEAGVDNEFEIVALFSTLNVDATAKLFMLEGTVTNLDLVIGAAIEIDISKEAGLRLTEAENSTEPQFGRLSRADLKLMTRRRDMFDIGARAGAVFSIGEATLGVTGERLSDATLGIVTGEWIPSLSLGVAAQLRADVAARQYRQRLLFPNIPIPGVGRRLTQQRRSVERLTEGLDHRGVALVRSLRALQADDDINPSDIVEPDFIYEPCHVNLTLGQRVCLVVNDINLDLGTVGNFVLQVTRDVANPEGTGFLDRILEPFEPLLEPLPGLSDILNRDVTIFDVAELCLGGGKAAVALLRFAFFLRDAIRNIIERLGLEDDGINIADSCQILPFLGDGVTNGLNCDGGLMGSALESFRPGFGVINASDPCPQVFEVDNCFQSCLMCSIVTKPVCLAKRLACKAASAVPGLEFPWMDDPRVLLQVLIFGRDIDLMRYSLDPISIGFGLEKDWVIFTPPTVTLGVYFEVSARLEFGLKLDTASIREAVQQKVGLKKIAEAFALQDTFGGVDKPMMVLTVGVGFEVAVSAVFVRLGVRGGIRFVCDIDLYDPYPQSSDGYVRPYQLLSLGLGPLEWWQFDVRAYIDLTIFIQVGLFIRIKIGFIRITIRIILYEYRKTWSFPILDTNIYTPDPVFPIAEEEAVSEELTILADRSVNGTTCTSLAGEGGDEEIECNSGGGVFSKFKGIKGLRARNDGGARFAGARAFASPSVNDITLIGIESETDFSNFEIGHLVLDYQTSGPKVLGTNTINILETQVLAGLFVLDFNVMASGEIIMPNPEQPFLLTTFGGKCNDPWLLNGHSDVVVNVLDIQQGCTIEATGGNFSSAKLTIDFGFQDLLDCVDGYTVNIAAVDDRLVVDLGQPGWGSNVTVEVGAPYIDVEVRTSNCNDHVVVASDLLFNGSIAVLTGGGNDTVVIGNSASGGLDSIAKQVVVDGGEGTEDTLIIDDSGSNTPKNDGELGSGTLFNVLSGGNGNFLDFTGFEIVDLFLGDGGNTFNVTSTALGSTTTIIGGSGDDLISVHNTQGDIIVDGGGGNDEIDLVGVIDDAVATIYGGDGNDIFIYDARGIGDVMSNAFDPSTVRWSGGDGDDTAIVTFVGNGTSTLNLFDDHLGNNAVNVSLPDLYNVTLLSRENFLVFLHNVSDVNTTEERINVERGLADEPTVTLSAVNVVLEGGENIVYFEDTIGPYNVFATDDSEEFYFGQLYNSERDISANVSPDAPIDTNVSTSGYLSNGNSHTVTVHGGDGNDLFDVVRNAADLVLNGNLGNDTFYIRSFIGEYSNGNVAITGYDDAEENDQVYVVGTSQPEGFVLDGGDLVGDQLSVSVSNVRTYDILTAEGNDNVTILSSSATFITSLYGSLGSDQFFITPGSGTVASYVGLIQGPLTILAASTFDIPDPTMPFMLYPENDTAVFVPPEGIDFDTTTVFAIESNEVDRLVVYNEDGSGDDPTVGTLTPTQLYGLDMAEGVEIFGELQNDGITYYDIEVIETYFGPDGESLIVESTSDALHMLDFGGGDDFVHIKNISAPMMVRGEDGGDTVTLSSDESMLDLISALVAFDGGGDGSSDRLIIDNSGSSSDDVLNVTRGFVEVDSLVVDKNTTGVRDPIMFKLRGATSGSLTLEILDPVTSVKFNVTIDYPFDGDDLESLIQDAIFPDGSVCGLHGNSTCSKSVEVRVLGESFVIFFLGERLHTEMLMTIYTDSLVGFEPEMFMNETFFFFPSRDKVAYTNFEEMDITMGSFETVVNVRGSTAATLITLEGGGRDDIFVSSEANLNTSTAADLEVLLGWLDYMEADVSFDVKTGSGRLQVSDQKSSTPKGVGLAGPAMLTEDSLTGLADDLGGIFFYASGARWSGGVDIWLGQGDDVLNVTGIPSNPGGFPLSTTTSIHAGDGEDTIFVALINEAHDGAVFVVNGQDGDDYIDGTGSTLNLVMFGDDGADTLIGGDGDDIVFGDFGRVLWGEGNTVFALAGGGGYGDFDDGEIHNITQVFSIVPDSGGSDTVDLGEGDDIGIGGFLDDTLRGGAGRDIVFGDSAEVLFVDGSPFPQVLSSMSCEFGGDDTIYGGLGQVDYLIGGGFNDTIYGDDDDGQPDGVNMVFGDHARIEFYDDDSESHRLLSAVPTDCDCTGGSDTISLGSNDDIAFGGAGSDTISGNGGQDVIFGDFGYFDAETEFAPFQHFVSLTNCSASASGDVLFGGDGDDILIGGEGNDLVDGEDGADDIWGGHNVAFGEDTGDRLFGGDGPDMIVGDNAMIKRNALSSSSYPWSTNFVWERYPSPFEDDAIRLVVRFDDIDYVGGNDTIDGGPGNDVLHGQRGNDVLMGGDGEDELFGEHGADELHGQAGNDICIGDVGYAIRRFDASYTPILNSKIDNTGSAAVWHKDVVLEEVGNITAVHRISSKLSGLPAEDIAMASVLFVAVGVEDDDDEFSGNFARLADLLLVSLEPAYDDTIDGGDGDDILFGQRGSDVLMGGNGDDFIVGDAGSNLGIPNVDLPRVYEIYRALSVPPGSIYDTGVTEFGVTFSADFNLFPGQYFEVDALASIADLAVNGDDVVVGSNVLKDLLTASALNTTRGFCMQPMFRVTTGFLQESQRFHGNDVIETGPGDNIVAGDDIRGGTALDLSELGPIAAVRERIDKWVVNLGARLSTLEVDTENFVADPGEEGELQPVFELSAGCDTITTDGGGSSFVTGDSLTILSRSVRASSLVPLEDILPVVLHRLHDIERILVDLHFALYEVHTSLLRRIALRHVLPLGVDQEPRHHLSLANDEIYSSGDNDVLIGDSSVLFVQVDRPGVPGFEFEDLSPTDVATLTSSLESVSEDRDDALASHVRSLSASVRVIFSEVIVWRDDVPFQLTVGQDDFRLNSALNLAVGDYAMVGGVFTAGSVDVGVLSAYTESMASLRERPTYRSDPLPLDVSSFDPSFYMGRYSDAIAAQAVPLRHGDTFTGGSSQNGMLGEFLTSFAMAGSTVGSLVMESGADVFNPSLHDDFLTFDGDTFDVVAGTLVDGQVGRDTVDLLTGATVALDADLSTVIEDMAASMFFEHALFVNWRTNLFDAGLDASLFGNKTGRLCPDPAVTSLLPNAVNQTVA